MRLQNNLLKHQNRLLTYKYTRTGGFHCLLYIMGAHDSNSSPPNDWKTQFDSFQRDPDHPTHLLATSNNTETTTTILILHTLEQRNMMMISASNAPRIVRISRTSSPLSLLRKRTESQAMKPVESLPHTAKIRSITHPVCLEEAMLNLSLA